MFHGSCKKKRVLDEVRLKVGFLSYLVVVLVILALDFLDLTFS